MKKSIAFLISGSILVASNHLAQIAMGMVFIIGATILSHYD